MLENTSWPYEVSTHESRNFDFNEKQTGNVGLLQWTFPHRIKSFMHTAGEQIATFPFPTYIIALYICQHTISITTIRIPRRFCGLEVACCPLVPKFAGSNPAEAVGFFTAKKILSTPSFGREVKPFVPYLRFTVCKRSLNVT